ncbi:hypothetical protein GQ53DRAFT_841191 [Thozetella sp. PMI_491]|nr:hypothetical protein GQ53DRAFT_841191 [Thozetella sp. PMI_491]
MAHGDSGNDGNRNYLNDQGDHTGKVSSPNWDPKSGRDADHAYGGNGGYQDYDPIPPAPNGQAPMDKWYNTPSYQEPYTGFASTSNTHYQQSGGHAAVPQGLGDLGQVAKEKKSSKKQDGIKKQSRSGGQGHGQTAGSGSQGKEKKHSSRTDRHSR